MTEPRPDAISRPHPDRFSESDEGFEAAMARHAAACEAGHQGYQDPLSKLFVMTATYLAGRPCCNRGCRHCPYLSEDLA